MCCWSKGTGGGGEEARTEKVLLRGTGEPGGKTTWEEERRERDEAEQKSGEQAIPRLPLGLPALAPRVRPVSPGHRLQDPFPHPPSHTTSPLQPSWARIRMPTGLALALAQPRAPPHYLLYQLPPSPPPTRLHSDDDALGQPVLGRGPCCPRCLLCLRLDAQPTLQLCDEPLLGWGPAQGGGVQPAARGGLPGHGVCVARLPAPPDHRADLRGEGEAVTVPLWAQPGLLSPDSGAPGRRGQNKTAREEPS